ncbi:MAG: type II secretion system F family protein [Planctomycetota bacterium]|nr:MAG: type II secretion system F family protein [Planctomycetota bacterium]
MSRVGTPSPFVYLAATAKGGRTVGLRQARSERALADHLRRDRLVLLKTWRLPEFLASEPKLTLKDQVELNSQLAMLLSRGVPLVEALEVTATVVSAPMQPVIERMRELVSGGTSFADACRKVGVFDEITAAVYQAAERTGDLGGSASQLADTARRQLAIQGKAGTVMLYPLVVLSIAFVAAIVLLTAVVPRIGNALGSMPGVELPWFTEVLVDVGNFMVAQWMPLVIGVGLVVIAAVVGRAKVFAVVGGVARRLPAIGHIILIQESARFFSVMAALTRAGVPLADALGISVQAVRHPALHDQLKKLRTKLVEGGVLHALIDRVSTLPLASRRLLMAAERAGDLDSAFEGLARDMADELDRRTGRLLAILEPVAIVAMFLIIAPLILALMIPLLTISNQIM